MGLITEPYFVFTGGTIFKFLNLVICKISLLHSVPSPPSFIGCYIWILYGCNPISLVNLCNDVLDMLNCQDACWVEVIGWSSKIDVRTPCCRQQQLRIFVPTTSFLISHAPGRLKSGHQSVNNANKWEISISTWAIWRFQNHSNFHVP